MITIFNGRSRNLGGSREEIWAQIDVSMRERIHLFKTGNSLNPFAVFMAIALYADANGWAWPATSTLMKDLGFTTEDAVWSSVAHLRQMDFNGFKLLDHYRTKNGSQWGKSYYHIFPNAGGAEYLPVEGLILWNGAPPPAVPGVAVPEVGVGGDLSIAINKGNNSPSQAQGFRGGYQTSTPLGNNPQTVTTDEKEERPSITLIESCLVSILHNFGKPKRTKRLSEANCTKLSSPVLVAGKEYDCPTFLYDTNESFRVWIDKQCEYFSGDLSRDKSEQHLVNLCRTYAGPNGWLANMAIRSSSEGSGQPDYDYDEAIQQVTRTGEGANTDDDNT